MTINRLTLSLKSRVIAAILLTAALAPTTMICHGQVLDLTMEAQLTAELARAKQALSLATQEQNDVPPRLKARLAELEGALAADRSELEELQGKLIGVLAEEDPAAVKAVQAEVSTVQLRQDVDDGEKGYVLKRLEEAGKRLDAWRQYAKTLDLALHLDTRVLLATAAEVDGRLKKLEACRQEITYQAGQVSKYQLRGARAADAWDDLRSRRQELLHTLASLQALKQPTAWQTRLHQALAAQVDVLNRGMDLQREWVLTNHELAADAGRNLAISHTSLLINSAYAAGLEKKALLQVFTDAQALAAKADADVNAARQVIDSRLKFTQQEQAAAAKAAAESLAALARAATPADQDQARADYDAAGRAQSRWEAQGECLSEFLAFQKAVAAFAKDKADKARNAATRRNLTDIEQELTGLTESARSSQQYVQSFKTLMQKLDSQVDGAARELGLAADAAKETVATVETSILPLVLEKPGAPQVMEGRLQLLAAKLATAGTADDRLVRTRQTAALRFLCRITQRELTRRRLAIAQEWLDNSQATIGGLEKAASVQLWQPRDPRLTWNSVLELGFLAERAVADAAYATQIYRTGLAARAGYASWLKLVLGLLMLGALIATGVWGQRRILSATAPTGTWFGVQMASVLPPLLAAGALLWFQFPGNRMAQLLNWLAFGLAGWWLLRCGILACCPDRRHLPLDRLPGAALSCARMILLASLVLGAVGQLSWHEENRWNIHALLLHAWWFILWLAAFRLLLHPTLLGRFLNRRSEHRGMRLFGACVAWACVAGSALAVIPYLLSLHSLGRMALETVVASFLLLVTGLVVAELLAWTTIKAGRGPVVAGLGLPAVPRLIKVAVYLVMTLVIATLWWKLLNQVLLSPNAPQTVQDIVAVVQAGVNKALRLWNAQLSGGMTVSSLFNGVIVFALSFWVSKVLRRLFLERVLARTPMDENTQLTFASVLGYVVIVVGFLIGLNVAGSSIQNLALLAGAITVGLGFGLQNVINNFVSSLLIHFGRTIRVGDYIDAAGQRGTVKEIGLRNTVIVTDDGVTVLVPNGAFVSSNVINWTNPNRRTRLHVPFTLLRQADLTAATQALAAAAAAHPLVARTPVPVVEIRGVTATNINLEVLAWTERPECLPAIIGDISLAADKILRENGFLA